MPVPRRFDRRPPERDSTRINERIRVPEVRLIGDDGEQVGVLKVDDALAYAQERDLDLVEVAPDAKPPVCRVLDYSKYKYELEQKLKAARKHQQQINVREIKFRPKIAQHDYDTKKGHVMRFLKHQDKVKVTIMFRGREVTHPERGTMILERLAEELAELAVVEQRPLQDGRNMTMMLGPVAPKAEAEVKPDEAAPTPAAEDAPEPAAEETPEPAAEDETAEPAAEETHEPAPEEETAKPAAEKKSKPAAEKKSKPAAEKKSKPAADEPAEPEPSAESA